MSVPWPFVLGGALLLASGLAAQIRSGEHRAYDARIDVNREVTLAADSLQEAAETEMRLAMPELLVSRDAATGALRSVYNPAGALTGPHPGEEPLDVALSFLRGHADLLGLSQADLAEIEVTDVVPSEASGAVHLYLRQQADGLPVYNGQIQVHLDAENRVLSVSNDFLPDLGSGFAEPKPALAADAAVLAAAEHLGVPAKDVRETSGAEGPQQTTRLEAPELSKEPIEARLMVLPIRRGDARLVWNFQIFTLDDRHVYDMTVDAASGQVWTRFDWVASDTYRVYPQPVESPNHTTPLPPADGRTLLSNPATVPGSTGSPFGWHDTNGIPGPEFTIMRGNNVHAYDDADANNLPPAVQPDCGVNLACDFPINLSGAPSTYRPAAIANLFYWNNLIHDIQQLYGFTPAAGNFQVNSYGLGGLGNDDVRAEAQDGGGINNANFLTLPDGQRPRMQMFLWNTAVPQKDGDLDSGIIVHEYGHGISNRLVGGPNNVSCLQNAQQPGEGLSDWWTLVYTHEWGDQGIDPRGIGTYALNQPVTGLGIRTQRYSTDPAVNTWTYASISGMAIPHGVGSVWAQGGWEVYWKLVDTWGFYPSLYQPSLGYGNIRAMHYFNEGLKFTPCSPTFIQVRDGVLQAASLQYGGVDVCRMWKAFAGFGLGTNATSGGPNSTVATNGFLTPTSCDCALTPFQPQIVSANVTSGNVVTATCPAGRKVVGGGCSDDFTSTRLRTSAPQSDTAWTCEFESNPGSLSAYALCDDLPVSGCKGHQIVTSTTTASNYTVAQCPGTKMVIGGGCRDNLGNNLLQSSYPWQGNAWVCGWVNASNPNITAYAICGEGSLDLQTVTKTETFSNVAFVQCPAGKKVVSGGCNDHFTSAVLESSYPWNDNGWVCNWVNNPGSQAVYAICEDP
jgi:extracellular elastinolytic metalloproteinase